MKIYLPKIFEQFSVLHQSERNKGKTRGKDINIWRRRERRETIARETIATERETQRETDGTTSILMKHLVQYSMKE